MRSHPPSHPVRLLGSIVGLSVLAMTAACANGAEVGPPDGGYTLPGDATVGVDAHNTTVHHDADSGNVTPSRTPASRTRGSTRVRRVATSSPCAAGSASTLPRAPATAGVAASRVRRGSAAAASARCHPRRHATPVSPSARPPRAPCAPICRTTRTTAAHAVSSARRREHARTPHAPRARSARPPKSSVTPPA